MSDELDRAQKAFQKQSKIAPSSSARNAALQMAMKSFEEGNLKNTQGNEVELRLSKDSKNLLTHYLRKMSMFLTPSKLSVGLAGGVSLAAIALVINLQSSNFEPLSIGDGSDTVAETEMAVADKEIATSSDQIASVPRSKSDGIQNLTMAKRAPAPIAAKPSNGVTGELMQAPRMSQEMATGLAIAPAPSQQRIIAQDMIAPSNFEEGRDNFEKTDENPVKLVSEAPVSTFSVDVDTASYSFVRAALKRGTLPGKDTVRIEEMINYFSYDYAAPTDPSEPFSTTINIMPTPWNAETKLMQIGIKGYQPPLAEMPAANLVFLIDTSGSMHNANKLPLLRNSFKLLLSTLKPSDTISIVTYAGSAGTALEPTKVSNKAAILSALDNLMSGGGTAGAAGIERAYQLAESQMIKGGVNRVILATDGDFNVGITDPEVLKSYVEDKRETGITLSILGFGQGNYNDALMQTLAQNGNGNASYIDTLSEARKVLVEEVGGTLFTIAKDVKLQLEFNPATVSEYRLIGYETRQLNREDFNNDKVDAGDIGAGHTVTALYEFTPVGSDGKRIDDLRYQSGKPAIATAQSDEYAFMKIRYKQPDSETSQLLSTAITPAIAFNSVNEAPDYARFAAAVAGFGQLLRGGQYTGTYSYDDVTMLAQSARGDDPYNYRGEFLSLVQMAQTAELLKAQ